MIQYLIKNNLKLMLRNKLVVLFMLLAPLLTIGLLSSAFEDMMKTYEQSEHFEVGYSVEANGKFSEYIEPIKAAGKETGITFTEYPPGNSEERMQQNQLAGFVEFQKEDYVIYTSEDYKPEGVALEYFVSRVLSGFNLQMAATEISVSKLPATELDFMPTIESSDYYGIIYVVYYSWCGIICIAGVLASEKKNALDRKFLVSPVSGFRLFLAKWISGVIVAVLEMTVVTLVSTWLFDITWGNVLASLGILLLTIIAANAYGLFLFYICRNLAVSVGALFATVWFMGFAGGSFETYMYSVIPDNIKNFSPIYHVNRALVEYSCMGKSEYGSSAIVYLLIIVLVSMTGAVLIEKLRREVGTKNSN